MTLKPEGEPCAVCGDWIEEGLYRELPDGRKLCLSCAEPNLAGHPGERPHAVKPDAGTMGAGAFQGEPK